MAGNLKEPLPSRTIIMYFRSIVSVRLSTRSQNNFTKSVISFLINLSIWVNYFSNITKGTRYQNSYMLHQNRSYQNPYPLSKKLEPFISQRTGIPLSYIPEQKNLKFNSNFESGNLDCAVLVKQNEYDLFMRVDTNTKGHTNWYYFTVQNLNMTGAVRLNICNFRRQKSLYQRGMRPYCNSKSSSMDWKQKGEQVTYEKRPLRYKFIYDQDYDYLNILKTYYTLSFIYNFQKANDTVEFAYFIPYTYTRLCEFITNLNIDSNYEPKNLTSLKSLSGLTIPILEITDTDLPEYNKKVLVVTGRIHPGEANSSFVAEGFLQQICSSEPIGVEFRKNFITYVIPMLNPDGVVAGNYRTSLFGKDLNRTYNQSRKFAFPETFHLLEFIKQLKAKHKQRFSLFIDLHGHSVKKNIFMYGPQYSLQQNNHLYYLSKELPRILSDLTSFFRYYSCIFKISSEKAKTARGILNKGLGITFTYTVECSNGGYYDKQAKKQFQFTTKKLKKMGSYLAQGLNIFNESLTSLTSSYQSNHSSQKVKQKRINNCSAQSPILRCFDQENLQNKYESKNQQRDPQSDDYISQGKSDSQPEDEDLSENELQQILATIQQGQQVTEIQLCSLNMIPQKQVNNEVFQEQNEFKQTKFSEPELQIQEKSKTRLLKGYNNNNKRYLKKRNVFLPPIHCINRNQERVNPSKLYLQPINICPQQNITTKNIIVLSPQRWKQPKISNKKLSLSQILQDINLDNNPQTPHPNSNISTNNVNISTNNVNISPNNVNISPNKARSQLLKQIREQIKTNPIHHNNLKKRISKVQFSMKKGI